MSESSTILSKLHSNASSLFDIAPDAETSAAASEVVAAAYGRQFNGGYFWGRALLVRPLVLAEPIPMTVRAWNRPDVWKGLYGAELASVTFFAEDAFGGQFGLSRDSVVWFDPETAELGPVGSSLNDWCEQVLSRTDYFTGAPVLRGWEAKNSRIQAGFRLIPKQPFFLGGEYDSNNMVCKEEAEGMRVRAAIWEQTRDLADGQSVVFRRDV